MIDEVIVKLSKKSDLTSAEMEKAFDEIMTGLVETEKLKIFLKYLSEKGETVDEIVGATTSLRKYASIVTPKINKDLLDIVGTGGDKKSSLNVSTASAIVASAAGCIVAKHGNRSVSSSSGSADVLESLGVKINLTNKENEVLIDKIGLAFLFAQTHHPAMKYATSARKELGIKTIFNLIGPLTNPANAKTMLLGVYSQELARKYANVISKMNLKKCLIVSGLDGFDEISICDKTLIIEVNGSKIKEQIFDPRIIGLKLGNELDLIVKNANESANFIRAIFEGKETGAKKDVVLLNSGAAIYVNGIAKSIADGVSIARVVIDSGLASKKLAEFVKESNKVLG